MQPAEIRRGPRPGHRACWAGLWLLLGLAAGCASTGPAPVEDRSGRSAPAQAPAGRQSVTLPAGASHRVVKGDTLYGIAFRNGLDYRDLARWNGIGPPYTIRVGEQLRLTDPGQRVAAAPARPAPASPVRPAAAPPASAPVATAPAVPLPATSAAGTRPVASVPPVPAATVPAPPQPAVAPPAPVAAPVPATAPTAAAASGAIAWRWPLAGSVLAGYVAGDPARSGIDISGKAGGQVVAAADGEVVYSGNGLVGYGELVIIKHSPSLLSAYARNGRRLVEERARVKAGQPIAELASGRPVLHFEIRRNGKPINPLEYLPSR